MTNNARGRLEKQREEISVIILSLTLSPTCPVSINLCINLYFSISRGEDFGKAYRYINWPLRSFVPRLDDRGVTGSVRPSNRQLISLFDYR